MNWKDMLQSGRLTAKDLASEKQLASGLGLSPSTLEHYRRQGLPYYRLGGRIWYLVPEVIGWILENCRRTLDSDEEYTRRALRGQQAWAKRQQQRPPESNND